MRSAGRGTEQMDTAAKYRVQRNFVSAQERRILNWLCRHIPRSIGPDHLTALGVFGAVTVAAGYVGTRFNVEFIWLANVGFFLHWLGDSLDGSLARYRRQERMRYGYFLDAMTDAVCNMIIMAGLGLSSYVRMDVSLFALLGYYLLCMYVFVNYHLHGVYELSFGAFGPTELRIGLIVMNTVIAMAGRPNFPALGKGLTAYDAFILSVGVAFVAIFLSRVAVGVKRLSAAEPTSEAVEERFEPVEIDLPGAPIAVRA